MGAANLSTSVEIREGAGELEDPVIAARRQCQRIGGFAQQRHPGIIRPGNLFDQSCARLGIAAGRNIERGIPFRLKPARDCDTLGN